MRKIWAMVRDKGTLFFGYKKWEGFWQLLAVVWEGRAPGSGMQLHEGRIFQLEGVRRGRLRRRRDCVLFLFFRLNATPHYIHPLLVPYNSLPPSTNFIIFPLLYMVSTVYVEKGVGKI